jgi:hypothetical protein
MENKLETGEMSSKELLRALDTAREDMEVYELQRTLEDLSNERLKSQDKST